MERIILITPGEWNHNGLTPMAQSQVWAISKHIASQGYMGHSFAVRLIQGDNTGDTASRLVRCLQAKFPEMSQNTKIWHHPIPSDNLVTFDDLKKKIIESEAGEFETVIVVTSKKFAKAMVKEKNRDFILAGSMTDHPYNIAGYVIDENKKHIFSFYSSWGTPEPVISE